MTPDVRTDRPSRKELGRVLMESGALSSDWAPTFAAVDRAAFLPDLMWPYDMTARASVAVDRREDPDAWYAAADSNVPIVTQWDDGAHLGPGPGELSTSSSSMPSVVYSLLQDLGVDEGMRVLDVGTGTGETAGALFHRLGPGNVTTIEVDGFVSGAARERLCRHGLYPEVVVGDGFGGHPDAAPYDRILATVGIRSVPPAWIKQARPGGVILAPWGTLFTNADAMVRLKVTGEVAMGPFTRSVEFMKLRAQRGPTVTHDAYLSAGPLEGAERSTTDITEAEFVTGRFTDLPFVLGLRVFQCRQAVAAKRDGARPVWFYGLTDRSWACVMFRDGERHASVWQSGPRRLWDEVADAYQWWKDRGSPELTRFGLTADTDGQRAWLDDPANESWPVSHPA
ncbi:protein-L-isoaspartate(D-aspartate) O-methyltransferase [Streptomyces echinoruber]|uniref:Protein-L-isoaspartate O-methyltransferase n=1 Tax=Streptomyces echinoruber TaxID=68898 RepID=A0A918VQ60_9ACTN|nr:protein-L-isoaspartate(D-aspartate) O-methyltransferase [Streptomyces echinoruber]GHA13596.1 protein-L-isoaspartate O-methyltransferase [Streptomyces echinoruber]